MADDRSNKKFMDKLFDPKTAKESVAFNATMTGLQLLGLLVFAFIGATVSFGFQDWITTLSSYDYWVTFVIMTAEQFYAYNVAYQFGLSLMLNTQKYKDAIQESEDILEGVYTEKPDGSVEWVRKPLKEDSAIIDIVANEMNLEERERLFRITIQKAVDKLQSKKSDKSEKKEILIKRKPARLIRWAISWILKLRISRLTRRIEKIERRINFLKEKQIDKEYLESLPDRKIPGYLPIDSAALHSNQEEPDDRATKSKWGMRKRSTFEKKGAFKKAAARIAVGIFMPLVAWGAVALKGGAVMAMIFMIIMQFRAGWLAAMKVFKLVDMYNASQRFKVLKEILFRVPKVKKRLEEEKRLAEEKARIEEESKKAFARTLAENAAKLLMGPINVSFPASGSNTHPVPEAPETNAFDALPKLNIIKSTP
jgi:hypothetical protein